MEWISIEDRFPEIPQNVPSYERRVKVIAAWGNLSNNLAEMEFSEDEVRGKIVRRFHWHGKLSPWQVTHWMPLPKPPKK